MISCKFCKTFNNTFLTKHLRPTTPIPKCQPTPPMTFFLTHANILWTHATHTKISTYATYAIFWPTPKFFGPTLSTPPTNPRSHATHATHAPTLFSRLATDVRSFTAAFILLGTITSAAWQLKIKATLIKRISSERNIISKYFQRCDGYCLFTQINFKHVIELGNLTLERLAFFEVK